MMKLVSKVEKRGKLQSHTFQKNKCDKMRRRSQKKKGCLKMSREENENT
jgi:hypothetical protein